jgi:catechol 2,3-dioxygenase-like lactoylglutathione lyase family enzyme
MKKLGFTYIFTDNIEKMKWFYGELLGLELIWDEDEDIAFKIADHQLSIQYHKDFRKPAPDYAIQPGWQGGRAPRTSWSIDFDAVSFKETVSLMLNQEIKSFFNEPQWKGYWSFPVLDPMNNTIEITCSDLDFHSSDNQDALNESKL